MSLCLANVDDSQIRTIVNEQWELSAKEINEIIDYEKVHITINSLKNHLIKQGYSIVEINELFRDKSICSKIKQNKALWKYKNNPDKQEDYH